MKIFLIILASLVLSAVCAVLAYAFLWYSVRKRGRHKAPNKTETTKKVVWICLINGSYVLAYLDKMQIAESLSQVAVTEIIGVVLAYSIKSAVENLSKHNRWPDKGDNEDGTKG